MLKILPILLAILFLTPRPAQAEERYAAVWMQNNGATYEVFYGMDAGMLDDRNGVLMRQGFRINAISGYSVNGVARYAGIWVRDDGTPYYFTYGMSPAELAARQQQYARQGFRIIDVCGYSIAGQTRYAAIWRQDDTAFELGYGLSAGELGRRNRELAQDGFQITHVSGYSVAGRARYAAIWVRNTGAPPYLYYGLTHSRLTSQHAILTSLGYQVVDISGYGVNGTAFYAAIWRQTMGSRSLFSYGLSPESLGDRIDTLRGRGYRMIEISGYNTDVM